MVMNYKKHYDRLIERSRIRVLEGYQEKHHIIPRCMGGDDSPDNLVLLTAEEHYVAHQLLVKIYPDQAGLVYAAIMMSLNANGNRPRNKLYGWLRAKYSNSLKNKYFSPETRKKISEAKRGKKFSDAHRKALSVAHIDIPSPKKGRSHFDIYGAKSNRIRSQISDTLSGVPQKKIQCPHCGKMGGKPIMTRYHFENCKAQKNVYTT